MTTSSHARRICAVAIAALFALGAVATSAARAEFTPRWVAGDLHLHTPYSHDSWAPDDDNTGPEEFYLAGNSVEGHFAVAAARGLDFISITDHNDIRSQSDPGFGTHGVLGIRGYENSLSGHAQMLGATEIYTRGTGVEGIKAMADLLRSRGGVFQINHPAGESVDWPHDPDWKYGYQVVPDTVEVWNITPQWQPPAPSGNDMEGAIAYWEGWLDRGYHIGMTGGSDNHYLGTTAIQGAGQPTTWVYVEQDGVQGVLEGLRAGRTFVSAQPPAHQGPRLLLEADGDGDLDYESMVGDTVSKHSVFRVVQSPVRIAGALSPRLVWGAADGSRFISPCDESGRCNYVGAPEGFDPIWVRAELFSEDARGLRTAACDEHFGAQSTYCRNRLTILAMTSAIYLAG